MPHPSHDVPGTLRRAPAGFAHALCVDQGGRPHRWEISDVYGRLDNALTHDGHVADWPIVYVPATPDDWADKIARRPAPRITDQHADAQETPR